MMVGQDESLNQNGMNISCSRSLVWHAVLDVEMVNFMFISMS